MPYREIAFFFLCSYFVKEDSSVEVSVDDFLQGGRSLLSQELRSLSATLVMIVFDVDRSARDFADSISLIHTIASIGRLSHEAILHF